MLKLDHKYLIRKRSSDQSLRYQRKLTFKSTQLGGILVKGHLRLPVLRRWFGDGEIAGQLKVGPQSEHSVLGAAVQRHIDKGHLHQGQSGRAETENQEAKKKELSRSHCWD